MGQFVYLHITDASRNSQQVRIPTNNCSAVTFTIQQPIYYWFEWYSGVPTRSPTGHIVCGQPLVRIGSFPSLPPALDITWEIINISNTIRKIIFRGRGNGYYADLYYEENFYLQPYQQSVDGVRTTVQMWEYCGGYSLNLIPAFQDTDSTVRVFLNGQLFRTLSVKGTPSEIKVLKQCPDDCPPGSKKVFINSNGDYCCCCC